MDPTSGESSAVGTYTGYLRPHNSDTVMPSDGEFDDHSYAFQHCDDVFSFCPQRIAANAQGDGTTTCVVADADIKRVRESCTAFVGGASLSSDGYKFGIREESFRTCGEATGTSFSEGFPFYSSEESNISASNTTISCRNGHHLFGRSLCNARREHK